MNIQPMNQSNSSMIGGPGGNNNSGGGNLTGGTNVTGNPSAGNSNGQPSQGQQQQQQQQNTVSSYSIPGILHYLQYEWQRFELERQQWMVEKAELQARIALLQGMIIRFPMSI